MTEPERWIIGVTWPASRKFSFADALRRAGARHVQCVGARFPRRQPRVVKLLAVWPLFVWVSIKLWILSAGGSARIVCWQQAYGILLGFAWRLSEALGFRCRSSIDVLTFILAEGKRSGFWLRFLQFSLSADAIKKIVVFGRAELDLYRSLLPRIADKFVFVTYTAADVPAPGRIVDEGFYLAVGRSNRDHEFLIASFTQFPDRRLIVLSDQQEKAQSANVSVDGNAFGSAYYQYLARCKAVVVAFTDPTISAGQLVYLQAVQYGKPVIVSESRCLEGYVLEDQTGAFFEKTAAALNVALKKVEDPDWYRRVTAACLEDYPARFGFDRLAEGYMAAVGGGRS